MACSWRQVVGIEGDGSLNMTPQGPAACRGDQLGVEITAIKNMSFVLLMHLTDANADIND